MLDIKLIRENPKLIKDNIKRRNNPEKVKLVDKIKKLDEDWRDLKSKIDDLRQSRNTISKEISEAKKARKSTTSLLKKAKLIPIKIEKMEIEVKKLQEERDIGLKSLPNLLDDKVPQGKEESDNKTLKTGGKKPKLTKAKGHADLVSDLDLADTERGAKVSGSRFYYLKSDLVLLNLALQKFALEFLVKKGYTPVQTPYMINKFSVSGAVNFEDFEESIYKIEDEDLYLIGTSEHALGAMHQNENLNVKKPIKYAGLSSCFRKEAGSHGKDTKGIFRVHRFEKIEQFAFCKPEDEQAIFDEIISNQEEIFKLLEIPYRISLLCSGETGGSMSKTCDLEGWFPAQKKYRELGSTSSATTYQSRKLNIKYQRGDKRDFVYTLNGTAMTIQRTMCCILENNQDKEGNIIIPKVLIPHMMGKNKIEAKK